MRVAKTANDERVKAVAAGLVLIALVLLFFWKLVFSGQYTFLDSPDTAFQVLPWYQVQARAWNAGGRRLRSSERSSRRRKKSASPEFRARTAISARPISASG